MNNPDPAHPDYPFPPGQHPARQPKRQGARQVGNVVPIRKPKRTAREIAATNAARNAAIEQRISASLAQLNRDLDERVANCRLEAAELGRIMHVQDLYEWLAIGRELTGRTTGRGGDL